jgi:hypothetical protein
LPPPGPGVGGLGGTLDIFARRVQEIEDKCLLGLMILFLGYLFKVLQLTPYHTYI